MTLKAAIWVHGSIFKPEYPERITRSKPIGWGMEILGKAGTYNWFHIPISTPVIMDGARPRLSKIFVFYNSATQAITKAALTDVHIYDGAIDASNSWIIEPALTIYSGLGISVRIIFPEGPLHADVPITFSTAGADFIS